MSYSSKTPMLESRKQKVGKVIKTLLKKNRKSGKLLSNFSKYKLNRYT